MELERSLIAAFIQDRKAYETFERVGNIEGFSPIARSVVQCVGSYYAIDTSAKACDINLVKERMLRQVLNSKHEKPIQQFIDDLPRSVSVANIAREIVDLHREHVGKKLSLALANGQGQEEVQKLIKEYNKGGESFEEACQKSLVDPLDTSDLTAEKVQDDYIKLWPKSLNDRVDGGALRGNHILIFARPEAGKTAFTVNLCAGFVHQQLSVLYVANEEPAADIRDRLRGRLLKQGKAWVRSHRSEAADRLQRASLGRISIIETTNFQDVRSYLGQGGWGVVVFDQLRNMRRKSDSRTAELESAGIEARAIAKEFNVLVVSVTQAGDSATNKIFPEMSDVDSSKTGLPASADLMIGLGSDQAGKANGTLGISLCKNKLSGLHDRFVVSVDFSTGVIS